VERFRAGSAPDDRGCLDFVCVDRRAPSRRRTRSPVRPGGFPTSSAAAATPLTPDTCACSPRSRRPTPARESRSSFGTWLVHGLPGDFLQEWDDIGGTSTFEATACSKLSPGNGLWPRRLRRWQIPAIPAVRTCDAFAPAPHAEPETKFGVQPRRPVGVARKAGLLPATEPGRRNGVWGWLWEVSPRAVGP
jgi:hypothetical protein